MVGVASSPTGLPVTGMFAGAFWKRAGIAGVACAIDPPPTTESATSDTAAAARRVRPLPPRRLMRARCMIVYPDLDVDLGRDVYAGL